MAFGDVATKGTNTSFPSFSGFGQGLQSFQGFGSTDLNNPDNLLALAQQQGGNIAAAANELVHPTTSILSTIGNGFKNAFKDFVDVISTPSEIVAGALSKDYTIGQAIQQHIKPSDVLFGESDPNATTMQKVGNFLVRTATDILTDPLTYVTFGAGQGVFGLRATSKITLGAETAKYIGVDELASKALSQEGQDVYKFLTSIKNQSIGSEVAQAMRDSKPVFGLAENELKPLLDATIDSPLNPDFAKKAISNLLEKNPALTETLLDKGGIKLFGNSIVSGQRIASVKSMIPGMSFIDNKIASAWKPIQALFDPSLIKVGSEYVRIPEEHMNLLRDSQDLASSLGETGTNNLANIAMANKLTSGEANFLYASLEAGIVPSDSRLASLYHTLRGVDDAQWESLTKAGIKLSKIDNHVPHIFIQDSNIKSIPWSLPPSAKVGAAMERKLTGTVFQTGKEQLGKFEEAVLSKDASRIDAIKSDLKNVGFENFDDNVITSLVQRHLDNTKAITMKNFMQAVGENFGKLESEAPQGWREISSAGIKDATKNIPAFAENGDLTNLGFFGKDGEKAVFHPAFAAKVEKFIGSVINDEPTRDLLKSFDKVQNLWKASVTTIFPQFHGRNAISNVFLHMMDLGVHSLNPTLHSMAGDLVLKNMQYEKLAQDAAKVGSEETLSKLHDLSTTNIFTDATGHSWSFGELRNVIRNKGIAFRGDILGPVDLGKGQDAIKNAFFPGEQGTLKQIGSKINPLTQNFALFKMGKEFGQAIEGQARILDFLANLRNTGDVTLAAQRTKQFLFDYSYLTPFEKNFLRRVMPFYTFTRKNLELQARALMETPGRVAGEVTALTNLSDVFSGGQLTDQEQKALPDWMQNGINFLAKKKGETVEIWQSLGTPIEQPFQALQPNALLGSISPLFRVPLEQATGYNFFQGKALSDVTNAAAFHPLEKIPGGQALLDFIGYTKVSGTRGGKPFTWYVSLRPDRMNLLLNLPPTSRVLSTLKQVDAVDVAGGSKLVQQLVGTRPLSFDLEQEAQKRENELRDKLSALLTNAGVTAQLKRTFVPKQ